MDTALKCKPSLSLRYVATGVYIAHSLLGCRCTYCKASLTTRHTSVDQPFFHPLSTMCRYVVLSVLLLLFVSPLVLCQPELPELPGMSDGEMFELQGMEEGFGAPVAYESPLMSKQAAPIATKAAPIVTKKAPRVRLTAVPYTYEKPVTHYENVAVPTTQIVDDEVLTFETVPVTQGKKGYGGSGGGYGVFGVATNGYHGAGLWEGPGGLWPGLGYGQHYHLVITTCWFFVRHARYSNHLRSVAAVSLRVGRSDWRIRLEPARCLERLRLIRQARLGQRRLSCHTRAARSPNSAPFIAAVARSLRWF